MLKTNSSKALFLTTYFTFVCLQIYSAFHHQLFGDEAFYWLESQNLAWSYAELPGWTQWMIALSQWLLPQHEFTIRLPGLLAAWTIPWLGMLINSALRNNLTQRHGKLACCCWHCHYLRWPAYLLSPIFGWYFLVCGQFSL